MLLLHGNWILKSMKAFMPEDCFNEVQYLTFH